MQYLDMKETIFIINTEICILQNTAYGEQATSDYNGSLQVIFSILGEEKSE